MDKLGPYIVWILAAEDVAASLAYFWTGHIRLGIYWLSAAILCGSLAGMK